MSKTVHSVTVRGSLFPAAGVLPRGEVATFAHTDRIADLVRKGRLEVVEYHYDEDEDVEVKEPSEEGGTPLTQTPVTEVPAGNATLEEWRAWFQLNELEYPEDAGRDALRAAWKNIEQQRAGGN